MCICAFKKVLCDFESLFKFMCANVYVHICDCVCAFVHTGWIWWWSLGSMDYGHLWPMCLAWGRQVRDHTMKVRVMYSRLKYMP